MPPRQRFPFTNATDTRKSSFKRRAVRDHPFVMARPASTSSSAG
jgi:hypothetical protein